MDNYANFSGTYGSRYHIHAQIWTNWQNAAANQSSIHLRVYLAVDSGYSWSGLTYFNAQGRINGGQVASGGFPGSGSGPGTWIAIDYDTTVTHDVNGNWSGSAGASAQASWSGIGSGGGDWGFSLARLALGPTISSISTPSIMPTAFTIAGALSSHGHGTSSTVEAFYRIDNGGGSYGSWVSLGVQAYSGSNTWTATGLKPGQAYQYTMNATNNNGDVTGGSYGSVTTLPAPNTSNALLEVVGVL